MALHVAKVTFSDTHDCIDRCATSQCACRDVRDVKSGQMGTDARIALYALEVVDDGDTQSGYGVEHRENCNVPRQLAE